MKSAVKIYNQCTTVCTYTESHFQFIFRPALFTWSWYSQGALQLRSLHCRSSAPSSFCHSRVFSGLANARLLCSTVGSPSRFMSSHPPPQSSQEVVSFTDEEKLTFMKAEYELYKAEGEVGVPSQIREQDLLKLVQLPSIWARKKYLRVLFLNEMKDLNRKQWEQQKRDLAKEKYQRLKEEMNTEDGCLYRNTMFIDYSEKYMHSVYSHRLIQAKLHGQPIVFDYDFDQHMMGQEKNSIVRQMSLCLKLNCSHLEPFDVHLCNFRKEEDIVKATMKALPTLLNDDYLVDVHSEDYLDIFPKNKLVYLTMDSKEEMQIFNHNAIYIIGGLIDKGPSQPITLAKAKKQKIKVQKLPLDRYLQWGSRSSKRLPLNQVLSILLEVKRSGSWEQAFTKHIPSKKFIKVRDLEAEAIKKYELKASRQLVKTWSKG